jgi:hypothetical protein
VIIKQQYGKLEQKAKKLEPVLQKKQAKTSAVFSVKSSFFKDFTCPNSAVQDER